MAFLMVDFELFELYPDLSDGARILYAFIKYKMHAPMIDDDGSPFINFRDDYDPRPLLNISDKVLHKRLNELKGAGLVIIEGKTWQQKIKLSDQMGTKLENVTDQTGANFMPKGRQVTDQTGTKSPNILINRNSINSISSSSNNTTTTYRCPTLEEVRTEASACGYISDPEKFFYYNELREWKTAGNWRAALKLWELREIEHQQQKKAGANITSITGADAGLVVDIPVDIKPQPVTITAADFYNYDNLLDI